MSDRSVSLSGWCGCPVHAKLRRTEKVTASVRVRRDYEAENPCRLARVYCVARHISKRTGVPGSTDQTDRAVACRRPPDQIARLLSDKMAAALGQPVIVENRTGGAGGIIGAKSVAMAEPDGYTLFMGSTSSVLIAPLIYRNAGYTAATFAPVARVAETTEMLALHPSVPANSVSVLVTLAKSRPGAPSYGSAGVGTLPHLEGEFLKTA